MKMASISTLPRSISLLFLLVICVFILSEYVWYKNQKLDMLFSHLKKADRNVDVTTLHVEKAVLLKNHRTEPGNAGTTCRIPITPLFTGSWHPSVWHPKENFQNCSSHRTKLFDVTDAGILTIRPQYKDCYIQDIIRGFDDHQYSYSESTPVSSSLSIRTRETFVVRCGNETNFDGWLPDFPAVTEKIKFWRENFPQIEDRPYSVLMFGFDSVSRAHAYRSIPKCLKLMKNELNFTDFKYYHAIGPNSFPNLIGFLLGMEQNELLRNAKPYGDDWPTIAKTYNVRNYVTKYLLTGENGFIKFQKRPVDYHARVLLRSLEQTREEEHLKFNDSRRRNCLSSTESSPDFVLRYTLQFLRKFPDIPFFNFDWLDSAFHDDENYLSNFEDVFFQFLQSLQKETLVLERTLIIFVTDHGYGHLRYDAESSEGFIQKRLPALFIRLPDQLVQEHPEILAALRSNSGRLTTPYDVHHTLEHLVFLKDSFTAKYKGGNSGFVPSWQNRSSLLVPIPMNRTCSRVKIPPEDCLCNFVYDPDNVHQLPAEYGEKAVALASSWLTARVKEYEFGHLCKPWVNISMRAVGPGRLVMEGDEFQQVLVPFEAVGINVTFEARVMLRKNKVGNDEPGRGKVLALGRTNSYSMDVDCLPKMTLKDAEMREFCMCRDKL